MVALNHTVAVAMVRGPRAGLDLLTKLETDERIAGDHRLHAVQGPGSTGRKISGYRYVGPSVPHRPGFVSPERNGPTAFR